MGNKIRLLLIGGLLMGALPMFAFASDGAAGRGDSRIASADAPGAGAPAADCSRTSVGFTPVNDLGTGTYHGYEGGLYPDGLNAPPAVYLQEGMAYVQAIQPLASNGQPDCNGRIVLLSIGMSNTTQEFSTFKPMADADPQKNPQVTIVDGAQGGQDAEAIKNPNAPYWGFVDQRLAAGGVTGSQVQAVWLKEAIAGENRTFPGDATVLQDDLRTIVGILRDRFPNLRIVYMSSRIYAGYATTSLNPEPAAYDSGFAVKWLVEERINGSVPARPWLAWGPYLWADGLVARSDGLQWLCSDLVDDGTHPSTSGRQKVANMLLAFFKTDSTATPWFVTPGVSCIPQPTATPCGACTPQPTASPTASPTRSPTRTPGGSTPTRTATPTPIANRTLVGRVLWQGRPAQPSALQQLPITLTLRLSGGPDYEYGGFTTDANGMFTAALGTVPNGVYSWRVKGPSGGPGSNTTPGFLATSGTFTLGNVSTISVLMGVQLGGDLNNDNVVNAVDFALFKPAFGTSCCAPPYDPRADCDGNSVIQTQDFNLIRGNFGRSGVAPVGP